jgi:hypothetical protein
LNQLQGKQIILWQVPGSWGLYPCFAAVERKNPNALRYIGGSGTAASAAGALRSIPGYRADGNAKHLHFHIAGIAACQSKTKWHVS